MTEFLVLIGGEIPQAACPSVAALACKAVEEGHIYLHLETVAGQAVFHTAGPYLLPVDHPRRS